MKRDRKGRFTKSSRWEKIIGISIVVGIVLPLVADAWYQEAKKPALYEAEPEEEVHFTCPYDQCIGVDIEWTEARIRQQVEESAQKYSTYADRMWNTILCENPELDPELQSHVINSHGEREDSWGLPQFHLPSKNKTAGGVVISKEMAQDPQIAIDAMAYHFSIGNANLWTCYRQLYM